MGKLSRYSSALFAGLFAAQPLFAAGDIYAQQPDNINQASLVQAQLDYACSGDLSNIETGAIPCFGTIAYQIREIGKQTQSNIESSDLGGHAYGAYMRLKGECITAMRGAKVSTETTQHFKEGVSDMISSCVDAVKAAQKDYPELVDRDRLNVVLDKIDWMNGLDFNS